MWNTELLYLPDRGINIYTISFMRMIFLCRFWCIIWPFSFMTLYSNGVWHHTPYLFSNVLALSFRWRWKKTLGKVCALLWILWGANWLYLMITGRWMRYFKQGYLSCVYLVCAVLLKIYFCCGSIPIHNTLHQVEL